MRATRHPAGRPERDEALRDLEARYVTGELSLERFEAEVSDVLKAEPAVTASGTKPLAAAPVPASYAERWEIHVHDAPAGHELHIHLP
jgi:hypothetical protein